jgi:tetratricopeptide (TPR) repeat protein
MMRRSTVLLALLLAGWGAVKVGWEERLRLERERLRFHGAPVNMHVREQMGQGMTLALLSGFRGVVADFVWLGVTGAWTEKEWFKVKNLVDLATTLQPRSLMFWEMGGWHLAWNASIDKRMNPAEPSEARRIREERFWIEEGRKVFQRGAENNPDRYRMWLQLAWVYDQKLKNFPEAARYYRKAASYEEAPIYIERFAGYALEKAGDDQAAYDYWKGLWMRPLPRTDPQRAWDKIEAKIRALENKLKIPRDKRVFPDITTSSNRF